MSEERYQQSNAKVKKTGKILLIIGIIVAVVGVILLIVGFVGAGNSAMDGFDKVSNDMVNEFNSIEDNPINIDISSTQDVGRGIFGGIIVMLIAHRREITAYTTQQVMPVAQEGIEKMAPTIGNAMGTMGKELAKGIKEGINEADNKK